MTLKYIDLFAGMGGIHTGFEQACEEQEISCECVFTSEIKPHAIKILKQNNPTKIISGDITKIPCKDLPDFDILLGGFPCQAFSSAGKRLGFADTRGTLFFEIERILKDKKPKGFLLENVEGLVNHDRFDKGMPTGRTLSIILGNLENLGYHVSWKVLNAKHFGVPQERKRIYITGTLKEKPDLENFSILDKKLKEVLETGLPTSNTAFTQLLLSKYSVEELHGKSIKDKRGGYNNIHSWDIECKGPLTSKEKTLLSLLLKERRKKKWAIEFGIEWMDGIPLTEQQIYSFFPEPNLKQMLDDIESKGYLKLEHPKTKLGDIRVPDDKLPIGYNIVTGKMSFEVNSILNPESYAPTLVAMDLKGVHVPDGSGIRKLTLKECLRLFGYPDNYKFDISTKEGYDLLGNTVVVPVIKEVSKRLLSSCLK